MRHTPPGMMFDESGTVPTVDFPFDELDAAPDAERDKAELREHRQEVVRNLLAWLAQNGRQSPHQIGTKVLILSHLLAAGTRKELAARLGVTRQRTHQLLTRARKELAFLRGFPGL